ncbi:ribonuclease domain-containing protein [Actinosynnema sp. NPDC020468]|uniref:ribonuclease domain-containing protein n=1 Tax=Actinosynnema sp. NPDC020468 TaxID=3154488 RepID=UPI0033E681B8
MTPARRLTVALIGLVVLVVVGYFAKDLGGDDTASPASSSSTAAASPSTKVAAGKSGQNVPGQTSGLAVKSLSELPKEAAATVKLIDKGGPFPYPSNDGVAFENREKLLPAKDSGYYKEYTVPTPDSPDRGARRLVVGSAKEFFYTGDHYGSFVVVDVTR